MKRGLMLLFIFLILIGSISIILGFSSENIGNLSYSINTQYAKGEYIKGWINISLSDEPANSVLTPSFNGVAGDAVGLLNLINKNPSFTKTCIPIGCGTDYSVIANSEKNIKNFNLNVGQSEIFGFNISGGEIGGIVDDSFSLDVLSNAGENEEPQLLIDILNDGKIEWQAYKASENFAFKDYGCFETEENMESTSIGNSKYCEKIALGPFPNITIGANITQEISGEAKFDMSIENFETGESASCSITTSTAGEINCSPVDYSYKTLKEQTFDVCIRKNSGAGEYKINYERKNTCGFADSYNYDFEIFAWPKRYAGIGSFTLNNTELINAKSDINNIESYIEEYIRDRYDNNCTNDCIVPIKFWSGKNQEITLSMPKLKYTIGIEKEIDKLHNLTEVPAKINANLQKLYLDKADFSVPDKIGNHTFSLKLDGNEIFTQEIKVVEIPVIESLSPKTIAAGIPTEFKVKVTSSRNITTYKWNFGGNDIKTSSENKIIYTYKNIGAYDLKITVIDSSGLNVSKTFSINVESPVKVINTTLTKKLQDLRNIYSQIDIFSKFYQDSIKDTLNLTEIEKELTKIQATYSKTKSEQGYISIITDLLKVKVPESISVTTSADSISFYPNKENINIDVLKGISEVKVGNDDEKYINAIIFWNQKNLDVKISFNELSTKYEIEEEPFIRFFDLTINEKETITDDYYLVFKELDDLKFKEDYSEKEESGYVYINLKSYKRIEFSTTGDVSFTDLPAFISPSLSKLSLEKEIKGKEKISKITLMVLLFILLVIIGFIIYLILQTWYKRKYESSLFKNRNDLYNLISYINNSKRRGMTNEEISNKLRKAGWNSEKVRYVIRKYAGKKTGMLEIPIEKILGKFKRKKEKQESQKNIKSPPRENQEKGYSSSSFFKKYQ